MRGYERKTEREREEGECETGRQSVIVKQHWLEYTCEFAVPLCELE